MNLKFSVQLRIMSSNRGESQVLFEIVSYCLDHSSATKSTLRAVVNLSNKLDHFLENAVRYGLLLESYDSMNMVYRATERGADYVDEYKKLVSSAPFLHKGELPNDVKVRDNKISATI